MRRPKYRKHTTRDVAFVEYRGLRRYFKGPWKSPESVAAYRKFLRDNGFTHVEPIDDKPQFVATVAKEFLAWASATYPPGVRSEAANCRAAIGHLVQADGQTPVAAYGPQKLKALQQRLAHAKLSRTYINAVSARVKRAFKWAVSEGLIEPAIYYALATVPGLRKGRSTAPEPIKRSPVLWQHVEPVLLELSPTVRAMVEVHWLTGVRSQSICGARASQFDRSVSPWIWTPKHKTEHLDHALLVFIGPKAQEILAPYFDGRDFLFQPRHLNGKRARGYRAFYDSTSYLRAVARAIERVNRARGDAGHIPHWTPHQLRHARGTIVREQFGLEAAQAALGHARIDATQLYAQKQIELARRVAEIMG